MQKSGRREQYDQAFRKALEVADHLGAAMTLAREIGQIEDFDQNGLNPNAITGMIRTLAEYADTQGRDLVHTLEDFYLTPGFVL
jgi:hypothetical protein